MPLTTLDPKTALIVVDLQKGIVALPTAHAVGPVVQNAALLAAAFRRHCLPVVLVTVAGAAPGRNEQARSTTPPSADWADPVPEMQPQPDDHLVVKKRWGAFTDTDLAAYLKNLGVTQVVVAGVATSIGVESTARFAHELGFNVTLAVDAMTDLNLETHINSVTRIFPRMGETGATADIVALLDRTRNSSGDAADRA